MKKIALAAIVLALCSSCALYSVKQTKEVKGEVIKRQVYRGELIDISARSREIVDYKTLFKMVKGSEIIYWGLPGVQGDSIDGCIVEGDSVKAVFGKNPEIIYQQGKIKFPKPKEYKKFYDSQKSFW